MPKPDEITPTTATKHVFMALYAEPGMGKTRTIGTSPGRVLIIRPAQDHTDSILPADKGRIEEWKIGDWDDMSRALDFLRHEGDQYDWVWVDSWSLLQDVLLDDLFETAVREKPARGRYGADKQEYGINMFRIGSWMRHVIGPDLFNFGFTAHPAVIASPDLDEDGDPIDKLMPWIQGRNMSAKLCGYMNVVAFMERGKGGRRIIRAHSDERFYGKDQFDAIPTEGFMVPGKGEGAIPKIMDLIQDSPGRTATKTKTKARTRRVVKK